MFCMTAHSHSLWPHGPGVIPVHDNFSHFERSEHFFPRKLWEVWRDPKPHSMGEWKKGRKGYNERKIWKTSRPELFFWFNLLAKSVSGTDKIWDMCTKQLSLAIIHASRLKHAQISRLIDGRMHHGPKNPAKISNDVFFPLVSAYFSLSKPALPELICNANSPTVFQILEKARHFPGKMRRIYSNSCKHEGIYK